MTTYQGIEKLLLKKGWKLAERNGGPVYRCPLAFTYHTLRSAVRIQLRREGEPE